MNQMRQNIGLKPYNTFGIDVKARWWREIQHADEAAYFIKNERDTNLPLWILGGGSNILFTKDFEGIILKNSILGKEVIKENQEYVYLRIGAGENWDQIVQFCIENNWGGIENLSLIPGCVGAAPIQNIGAYGVELKDIFEELEAIYLNTGQKKVFTKEMCKFDYRYSVFKGSAKGDFLITHVVLRLTKHNHQLNTSYGSIQRDLEQKGILQPTIKDISHVVCDIRRSKLPDPQKIGNAGSFFKNPVVDYALFKTIQQEYPNIPFYLQPNDQIKIPAGWLIEMCGWKGKRMANYGVHKYQALVLVNYGGASGQKIYDLSTQIAHSVKEWFNIELEREVNVL